MRHTRRYVSLAVLLFVCSLAGCAVQKNLAPQISTTTADALNVATLVNNAQHDYLIFFQTVGTLEKAHALSVDQVATLNLAGNKVRDILDAAGNLCQTYAATNNQSLADQITADLTEAATLYAQIYASRAAMLSQNAAVAAKVSGQ